MPTTKLTAAPFIPRRAHPADGAPGDPELPRRCELYKHATQAVFGEGPPDARVMMIGEQPGDQEDLAGKPFVGLGRQAARQAALDAAGIDRRLVFMTNAVKHFKFVQRGKRRIHDKPTRYETQACKPWVDLEIEMVQPRVLVLLGATAAQSLLGTSFRVSEARGKPFGQSVRAGHHRHGPPRVGPAGRRG